MQLPIGTPLQGGKYKIDKKLGQGSFGITYLATAHFVNEGNLGKMDVVAKVAVKEFFMRDLNLRNDDGTSVEGSSGSVFTNYRQKFRKEAENLAKLLHPNIVRIFDIFDENGTTYYVMEYLEGDNLDDYIKRKKRLSEPEAVAVIGEIGKAVDYMHSTKMLHLDIKPKNVMHRADSSNILIDFGLSKQFAEDGEPETSTSIGMGTPGYAPLEQSQFRKEGSFPATLDVYALGATMFKLLTGRKPPEATVILNEGFPREELENLNISPATVNAVEKAMHPMKKDRFQTVRSFMDALGTSSEHQFDTDDDDDTVYDHETEKPKPFDPEKPAGYRQTSGETKPKRKEETKKTEPPVLPQKGLFGGMAYALSQRNGLISAVLFVGLIWFFYVAFKMVNYSFGGLLSVIACSAAICAVAGIIRLICNLGDGKYLPLLYIFVMMMFCVGRGDGLFSWVAGFIIPYSLILISLNLSKNGKSGFALLNSPKIYYPNIAKVWKERNLVVNLIVLVGMALTTMAMILGIKDILRSIRYGGEWDWDWVTAIIYLYWFVGQIYLVIGYRLGSWIQWTGILFMGFFFLFHYHEIWTTMFYAVPVLIQQLLLLIRSKGKTAWSVMK